MPWRRKWQPSPTFLPGEPHVPGRLQSMGLQGCQTRLSNETTTKLMLQIRPVTDARGSWIWVQILSLPPSTSVFLQKLLHAKSGFLIWERATVLASIYWLPTMYQALFPPKAVSLNCHNNSRYHYHAILQVWKQRLRTHVETGREVLVIQACVLFFFFSWRLITLQYCSGFCHTLTWISHGFTCVPHPEPPSHLPLHPIPLGLPSAPGPSTCLMHPTWAGDLFH